MCSRLQYRTAVQHSLLSTAGYFSTHGIKQGVAACDLLQIQVAAASSRIACTCWCVNAWVGLQATLWHIRLPVQRGSACLHSLPCGLSCGAQPVSRRCLDDLSCCHTSDETSHTLLKRLRSHMMMLICLAASYRRQKRNVCAAAVRLTACMLLGCCMLHGFSLLMAQEGVFKRCCCMKFTGNTQYSQIGYLLLVPGITCHRTLLVWFQSHDLQLCCCVRLLQSSAACAVQWAPG